jgi:hypothetical protein
MNRFLYILYCDFHEHAFTHYSFWLQPRDNNGQSWYNSTGNQVTAWDRGASGVTHCTGVSASSSTLISAADLLISLCLTGSKHPMQQCKQV